MTDIVLSSCSGGIVNQVLVDDLRGDKVAGDPKPLADIGNFTGNNGESPTASTFETDFNLAYGQAKASWAALDDELHGDSPLETTRLRDKLVLPLLRSLGFDPQFQRSHLPSADGTYRITHIGWDGFDALTHHHRTGRPRSDRRRSPQRPRRDAGLSQRCTIGMGSSD